MNYPLYDRQESVSGLVIGQDGLALMSITAVIRADPSGIEVCMIDDCAVACVKTVQSLKGAHITGSGKGV